MELFHRILRAAVEGGASDVHLKIGSPVTLRVNRQLLTIEAPTPTADWINSIIERIVPKHGQSRLEEEREVDFSYFAPGLGRFRTNVFQQRGEFCLALRFVKTSVPSFEELGLLPILRKIAESPRGIVLLAGSTGCGKSTTLAAMIEHINAHFKKHIITLEDPIEYVFEDNQSVIDTGHLVLSTLHTTNASQSVSRILDFFKADEREQIRRQLAGTLQAVICQRMVATIAGSMTPAVEVMINTPTVK